MKTPALCLAALVLLPGALRATPPPPPWPEAVDFEVRRLPPPGPGQLLLEAQVTTRRPLRELELSAHAPAAFTLLTDSPRPVPELAPGQVLRWRIRLAGARPQAAVVAVQLRYPRPAPEGRPPRTPLGIAPPPAGASVTRTRYLSLGEGAPTRGVR